MKILSEIEIEIVNGGAAGGDSDFEPEDPKGWWDKWWNPWSNDGLDAL